MGRVAAIGLDAAEWSLVQRFMHDGTMPALARVAERSRRFDLENVVPYRSELPWTQFVTGRSAASNRYWSTVAFDPERYETFCVGAHPERPFWALDDVEVIAFDVPHSTIHPDVRGSQVTAWGAHSAQYPRAARPQGLLREIDERFGVHPALDNDYDGTWYQPRFLDALGEALLAGARTRVDAAEWLMERQPQWRLLVTVLSESHSGGHHFWHGVDPSHPLHGAHTAERAASWLRQVYRALDDGVGRLAARLAPDDHLVVFSVHGMQANFNDVPSLALLPELAHRLHFGEELLTSPRVDAERWIAAGCPPVQPPARLNWRQEVGRGWATTPAERRARSRRAAVPDRLVDVARGVQRALTGKPDVTWDLNRAHEDECDLSPEEMAARRTSLAWQLPHRYRPWWPQMRWFVLPTFSDAHVRINLAGREAEGVVPPEDYEAACDEVEAAVRACRDPRTGRPVVEEVVRLRQGAEMDPDGPDCDLVVIWSEAVDALEHPEVGVVGPLPFQRTGEHSANGWAYLHGPGIDPGEGGTRSAFDVTPTIVSLLGCPLDDGFEGRPLLEPAAPTQP